MQEIKFTFVGGDLRSASACSYLNSLGFATDTFLLENAPGLSDGLKSSSFPKAGCYILGLPATDQNSLISTPLSDRSLSQDDFFKLVPDGAFVAGGLLSAGFLSRAAEKGITAFDYFSSEELQIRNSVPTAEGALEIAMREMPVTISDSHPLVIGFGRIAKSLLPMLMGLGAPAAVCSRSKESLIRCSLNKIKPVTYDALADELSGFDLIFNTAPAKILSSELLDKVTPNALIIDLASKPGGVDFKAASEKGIKVIWALSLPGKCAPVSAGRIIADTVLNELKRR